MQDGVCGQSLRSRCATPAGQTIGPMETYLQVAGMFPVICRPRSTPNGVANARELYLPAVLWVARRGQRNRATIEDAAPAGCN